MRKARRQLDIADEDWGQYLAARDEVRPDERILLQTAMKILSDTEQQIVMLHAVAGVKHREIAAILGMPTATVLSKYSRAIKNLGLRWRMIKMKDNSIESRLRSAVSHAAPDALDDILSACDHEKGKVIYMEKKRTSPLRSFAAIAAVLVLVIAGIFAVKNLGGSTADTLAAVVSLDVNPSIELNVDKMKLYCQPRDSTPTARQFSAICSLMEASLTLP